MFLDREQVWWIVPAGQQIRHAITQRPGSRPSGYLVTALCSMAVKLPHETWPTSREPTSRAVTTHCSGCESVVAEHRERNEELVVANWEC